MTFICHQNWDNMKATSSGRFCSECKKEVFDYTTKSFQNILNDLKEPNISLCGRFSIEQVDTSLVKPIEFPKPLKFIAFISAFTLTLSAKTSFAQTNDKTKTEQTENTANPKAAKNNLTECDTIFTNEKIKPEVTNKTPFLTTKKRRYYWTKNIPFVRSVRIQHFIVGRFL